MLPNENEDISLPQLEKDEVETETKIIEIQPEVVKKIPSYLDKLPYAEGMIIIIIHIYIYIHKNEMLYFVRPMEHYKPNW